MESLGETTTQWYEPDLNPETKNPATAGLDGLGKFVYQIDQILLNEELIQGKCGARIVGAAAVV